MIDYGSSRYGQITRPGSESITSAPLDTKVHLVRRSTLYDVLHEIAVQGSFELSSSLFRMDNILYAGMTSTSITHDKMMTIQHIITRLGSHLVRWQE